MFTGEGRPWRSADSLLPEVDPGLIGLQLFGIGILIVAQGQGGGVRGEILGRLESHGLGAEGADHQNSLTAVAPGVHIQLPGALAVFHVVSVLNAGEFLAQGNGLTVEVQQGIRVLLLGGYVDFCVVGVYIKPGLVGGCKACVGAVVPLNQGPGGVPGGPPQPLQPFFGALICGMV